MSARTAVLGLVAALTLTACVGPAAVPSAAPRALPSSTPVAEIDPVGRYADDRLGVMTLEEKIQSMLMIHVPGVDAAQLAAVADANNIGGLILMGDNIPETTGELTALTAVTRGEPGLPRLIAIDQEGGVVRRIFSDTAPGAGELRTLPPDAATEAFASRGALLASLGLSVNFGIVADVTGDSSSFIFERSMGGSAEDASARVAASVAGEHGFVLSTLKHFPGHGVAPGDSHSSIPSSAISLQDWSAQHAPPFAAGITAGAQLVMFGHLQLDAVDPRPATLSARWHEILRDEMEFTGVMITDDMSMLERSGRPEFADTATNAIAAVAAGNTMILYVGSVDVPGIVTAIAAAVRAGSLEESTIDDAARQLLVLRRTLSGETGNFVHCFESCQALVE